MASIIWSCYLATMLSYSKWCEDKWLNPLFVPIYKYSYLVAWTTVFTFFYKFQIRCAFSAVYIINSLFYNTRWLSSSLMLTFLKLLGGSVTYSCCKILAIMLVFFRSPSLVKESIIHSFYYSFAIDSLPASQIAIASMFLMSLNSLARRVNYFL